MAIPDVLHRLTGRLGIAPDWRDVFGEERSVPESTLRALAAALGHPAQDEAQAEQSLRTLEAQEWERPLPPALVVRQSALPPRVRLQLPESDLGPDLAWRALLEDGGEMSGSVQPASLPVLERAEIDGVARVALQMELPASWPLGYHRLELSREGAPLAATHLIVAPDACYRPPALTGAARVWGIAAQLYALRSERNWGMGDFTDLAQALELWGSRGASVLGVNPLHALFPDNPGSASPYCPSSRLFLNLLYLDPEAIADFAECEAARRHVHGPEFQMRLAELRTAEMVDYPAVAALKLQVLEMLFRHFCEHHIQHGSERAHAFHDFVAREGEPLRRHALFEALQRHLRGRDPHVWGWPAWPEAYRDPESPEVEHFAAEHADDLRFFQYLQWQADIQLDAVGKRSLALGLGVGLYLDLAVSADRGGAEVWSDRALYAQDVRVGCPPDLINRMGQDWGLPPMNPRRLREEGYRPFAGILRRSMLHAGALRIDHVMWLMRLYWIPAGAPAHAGAYVDYPFDDMLGVLALESQRNCCAVVGEDLGTVPEALREAVRHEGLLSYRPLLLELAEHDEPPKHEDFPVEAVVTASTHDLPTVAGYWLGRDLVVSTELQLYPDEAVRGAKVVGRAQERARLLLALERERLLPEGATVNPVSLPEPTGAFLQAVQVWLAGAPSRMLMVQMEDVLGAVEQVNLPGTVAPRYPNWRRKLTLELERWPEDRRVTRLAAALAEVRRLPSRPAPAAAALVSPRATYRLQFNAGFTFRDTLAIIPYLARLGVSHVYGSPYLRARPGSPHGYDIIDHNAINPEIGSQEDYARYCEALARNGLGQILDFVPNHMGVMGSDNAWWLDVLENGPASVYAPFFDIDWEPVKDELQGKVLLPVLGAPYGEVLERGELVLGFDRGAGSFSVTYWNHRFPVAPREYRRLLQHRREVLRTRLGADNPLFVDYESLITAFERLPSRRVTSARKILERHRECELAKQRLARLCQECPPVAEFIDETVREFNGTPGEPRAFDALHRLLEAQPYRLSDWRCASDEINYRRFFDINELAALRMEEPRVFDATHQLVLQLLAEGKVQGLRIDHPDGLYDPLQYYQRLQSRAAQALGLPAPGGTGDARAVYLVVEKILAAHEPLPASWPVHGSTGYEFLNLVNGLLVDERAAAHVERTWRAFTGEHIAFDEEIYRCKRLIMTHALASELNVLAWELNRISEADRHTRDYTLNHLREALAEVVACLPVYRTYVRDGEAGPLDRRYVDWAVAQARRRSVAEDTGIFDFVRAILLCETPRLKQAVQRFAMRFQQFSSPVMAKGLEDTALYRHLPLASLNEVGGDPRRFGVPLNAFHETCRDRQRHWPHAMLTTSTHDTKRSEDVRTRIDVLSELPGEWRERIKRWARINRSRKKMVDGAPAPSRGDEYLLYQTLLGTMPPGTPDAAALEALAGRVEAYMLKAARETKLHTSWINRNADYEAALSGFVRALLDPSERNLFLAEFLPFQRRVGRYGMWNSLSQVLLKLTVPGVPDIYQGCELWDLSLVDPDNRRPVDYAMRAQQLDELEAMVREAGPRLPARVRALLDSAEDGRCKLLLIWRALSLRQRLPEPFADGDYLPLTAAGPRAANLCAFARRHELGTVLVLAPRLTTQLAPDADRPPLGEPAWGNTRIELPPDAATSGWVDAITGARHDTARGALAIAAVLENFPVALLVQEPAAPSR